MLVDRDAAEDVFSRVPRMAARIDPVLNKLDQLLDDDEVYHQVRADFGQRYRYTLVHGRHSTPVEVLLRMLIVKHLHQWSYQGTEEQVDQNLILRWFCSLYWAPVPDESTLVRWANTLRPETLHALNDRVVELARKAKVTRGRKLRLDATCVQTNIHHPTDSGLLVDSVRVLSRFVQRAKELVKDRLSNVQATCRSRLRSARQTAQTLHWQLRRKVEEKEAQQKKLYEKLIQTAEQMVRQARRVVTALGERTEQQARRLLTEAQQVLPLVVRVITQTRTRVLEEKKVASGKTGAQLLRTAYARHSPAQGRRAGRVWSARDRRTCVEGGIVTRYQILSHPTEHGQAVEAVAHHQALFEHPPGLVAGDRGVQSAQTEERLKASGVKRVAIPAVGKLSEARQALERTRNWKRGYRWRAGIEGRIASLRRDFGWRKSAYHGPDGMERWLGLEVMASNLRRIALAH